jgi:hypothetical protein
VSKQYGIKLRCYLECFRGTFGELDGNTLGARKKILKEKKYASLSAC